MEQRDGVEQDISGSGDDLPTYANLAENHGPNSRFGRWRDWVEKRAAERYLDDDPSARARRRGRGWGDPLSDSYNPNSLLQASAEPSSRLSTMQAPPHYTDAEISPATTTSAGQVLEPSHISIHTFGSRFLPHAKSPIRTLLPIMQDRFLLLGTSEGLSMLDMYPQSSVVEQVSSHHGPQDALQRELWRGESVYQLSILESQDNDCDVPQGVVMALVGAEPTDLNADKDKDQFRSVRMYNLSSLASLASWAASQEESQPIELQTPSRGNQQSLPKRHRPAGSITKSLKALVIESSAHTPENHLSPLSPGSSPKKSPTQSFQPLRANSSESTDSQWDMMDDLPLRWATDFVPLATSGSKLAGISVSFFELWRNDNYGGSGEVMLAVVSKNQILLYETPRGERAFRFVKDFYTPLPPRKLTFIHQRVADAPSETTGFRRMQAPSVIDNTGRLCMFVVFDKKAGIIRLNDSAVGEVELFDDSGFSREPSSPLNQRPFRRSISHIDSFASNGRDMKGLWSIPVRVVIPVLSASSQRNAGTSSHSSVYLLSRGKCTHILPTPLPNPVNSVRPLMIIRWNSCPSRVAGRACQSPNAAPYLQILSMGEDSVEVQEIPLSAIGKGKAKGDSSVKAMQVVGIECGYLSEGGNWDQCNNNEDLVNPNPINGSTSPGPTKYEASFSGVYGWSRKDHMDWRVFWMGGISNHVVPKGNVI